MAMTSRPNYLGSRGILCVCTTAVNRNFSVLSPTIDVFLTNCLPDYIVVLSLAKQCYLVMEGDNNCTTDYQMTFLVR
ncbi:hypothetical protein R2896_004809 [Salmonella enterica]|uniref:hypothetical protein n=1 Tax=Salmonella enterica TaxID=28901 RepID=UPI000F9DE1B1|nr:hypothetical protein [Salmonella enterica]EBP8982938.1 hypothetical protein [Salmonella enterica subsp. enterica]ECX3234310.1 hypothetical protein [Salmonella enterica subsp. enterica serovar Typhimurium]EAB3411702.1 hypothetical protein [Salmonella enterica]EAB4834090.1 hypothetical protein [Salmonella enterica]EAM2483856.1 hypothetical protein [Salmonella enterica]